MHLFIEFPTCLNSVEPSSLLHTAAQFVTAPAAENRGGGGRYHDNRVAGECLYGVRGRQCYRLFCSKQ